MVGIEFSRFPASHVAGALGEALDELTSGRRVDLPTFGELNLFRGVLSWAQRKKGFVIAKCVFRLGEAVRRKVSNQEMCRIFDYPTNRFSEMTEQAKELLTDNDIPGKVVLDAIYFLDK